MKGLLVHAMLALAGLAFAYQTWSRPAVVEVAQPVDDIVLLPCEPDQLETIEIDFPTHNVLLKPDETRSGYWITSTPAAAKKAQASGADAGLADDKKPELKGVRAVSATAPVTFRGNVTTPGLVKQLVPARALRDLGKLDPSRDADFGFDKAGTTYKLKCGGKELVLTVAGRTYGNNDHYVRDRKTGKSYLMLGQPFNDLQAAQYKLMQNELSAFKLDEVDEVVVSAGGLSRRLLQRDRALRGQAQWVDAAKPDQRNETFGNWLVRVSQLKARSYMPRTSKPGDESDTPLPPPVTVLEIEYKLEGKPKGKLEVARIDNPNGERYFYARSEATATWVTLFGSAIKEVEADIPLIVGEAASRAEPASTAP